MDLNETNCYDNTIFTQKTRKYKLKKKNRIILGIKKIRAPRNTTQYLSKHFRLKGYIAEPFEEEYLIPGGSMKGIINNEKIVLFKELIQETEDQRLHQKIEDLRDNLEKQPIFLVKKEFFRGDYFQYKDTIL